MNTNYRLCNFLLFIILLVLAVLFFGFVDSPKEVVVHELKESTQSMIFKIKWHVQDMTKKGYEVKGMTTYCPERADILECTTVIIFEKR